MYEISFVLNLDYVAYLLIGLGFGYLVTLGVTKAPSDLDRAKDDLAAKKEWIRMLSEQKKNNQRWKKT